MDYKSSKMKLGITISAAILLVIINIFTRWIFDISTELHFIRGKYFFISYIFCLTLDLNNLCYIIKNRKQLKPLYSFIIMVPIPFSILGAFLQYFFPWLEIEIFSSTFSSLLISMIVLQPVNIMDYSSGAFNIIAFEEIIRQNITSKRRMRIIYFKILNTKTLRFQYGNEGVQTLMQDIIKEVYSFRTIMNAEAYHIQNGIFAAITQDENPENLQKYLAELVKFLSMQHSVGKYCLNFDYLISVARCPQDLNSYEQIINYALNYDLILKKKNQVTYYSEEAKNYFFVIDNNIDEIIKKALIENHFQMYYQPVYSVKDEKFTSAEALIRLVDDKYGVIMPSTFISSAENTGSIHQIGDYILDSVCRFASRFDFQSNDLNYFEINLSVAQCIEPELPQKVYNALKLYNIPPERLNLELTETSAEEDPGISDKNIKELSRIGVKLSLDDFGTGYSNLRRLAALPMDVVKLDKVFVNEINRPGMDIIIQNIVSMLKKLNKKILIEGVETREQYETFVSYGVDFVQGYYFSKPLTEREFVIFISKHNSPKKGKV